MLKPMVSLRSCSSPCLLLLQKLNAALSIILSAGIPPSRHLCLALLRPLLSSDLEQCTRPIHRSLPVILRRRFQSAVSSGLSSVECHQTVPCCPLRMRTTEGESHQWPCSPADVVCRDSASDEGPPDGFVEVMATSVWGDMMREAVDDEENA